MRDWKQFRFCIASDITDKSNDPMMKTYRATPAKISDLVHTKLDVRFDYKKCYLYSKEWVTLKPHFYPTDSLKLDVKGMDLNNISVIKNDKAIPLKYSYDDSLTVNIHLDKVYHNNETYTIFIDYTSKPNQLKPILVCISRPSPASRMLSRVLHWLLLISWTPPKP